jgi:hypothetical protein
MMYRGSSASCMHTSANTTCVSECCNRCRSISGGCLGYTPIERHAAIWHAASRIHQVAEVRPMIAIDVPISTPTCCTSPLATRAAASPNWPQVTLSHLPVAVFFYQVAAQFTHSICTPSIPPCRVCVVNVKARATSKNAP